MSDDNEFDDRIGDYPVAVTFRFKTIEAKEHFIGGLTDGFGENACSIMPERGANYQTSEQFTISSVCNRCDGDGKTEYYPPFGTLIAPDSPTEMVCSQCGGKGIVE